MKLKYGHSGFFPSYCMVPPLYQTYAVKPTHVCARLMLLWCLSAPIDMDELDDGITARPRRLSEFNIATKTQPIPPASSFFIFSKSNR